MSERWHRVACADEVGDRPLACVAGGIELVLLRIDEALFAVEDRCPHQGSPLRNGVVRDGKLVCTWHHWEFDLPRGQRYLNPAARCATYPIEERNGDVYVAVDPDHLPPAPGGYPRPGIDPPTVDDPAA